MTAESFARLPETHARLRDAVNPGARAGQFLAGSLQPCSVLCMNALHVGAQAPLSRSVDAIKESMERLEARLPAREDSAVLVDFLEDDLREGLDAIAEVEAHFTDVLDVLRNESLSPIRLIDVAEDFRVLNRLEYLMVVVAQLRRRLSQAAGKVREGR